MVHIPHGTKAQAAELQRINIRSNSTNGKVLTLYSNRSLLNRQVGTGVTDLTSDRQLVQKGIKPHALNSRTVMDTNTSLTADNTQFRILTHVPTENRPQKPSQVEPDKDLA